MALIKVLNFLPKNILVNPLFNYYTAGENIISLNQKIIQLNKENLLPIADYIKEFSKTESDVNENINEYNKLGQLSNLDFIAIKLSSFLFNEQKINNTVENLVKYNKKVLIDAEDVSNQEKINNITNNLIVKYNIQRPIIYKTYQMYRKDSLKNINDDLKSNHYNGFKIVRGAYYNQDKQSGLLYSKKEDTDKAFNEACDVIFNNLGQNKAFICTHNQNNINKLIKTFNKDIHQNSIFHASLYGFINNETSKLIGKQIKTYKYLPYGSLNDALPYLSRRLYENPSVIKYLI